jgi:hypothetical protein
MKATNIQWDTDGQDITLPKEIEIPDLIASCGSEECEEQKKGQPCSLVEEAVSNYITDETGFCHNGFDLIK